MRPKMVMVTEEQFDWIDQKCLNFSKWVRKMLETEMNNEKKEVRQ